MKTIENFVFETKKSVNIIILQRKKKNLKVRTTAIKTLMKYFSENKSLISAY